MGSSQERLTKLKSNKKWRHQYAVLRSFTRKKIYIMKSNVCRWTTAIETCGFGNYFLNLAIDHNSTGGRQSSHWCHSHTFSTSNDIIFYRHLFFCFQLMPRWGCVACASSVRKRKSNRSSASCRTYKRTIPRSTRRCSNSTRAESEHVAFINTRTFYIVDRGNGYRIPSQPSLAKIQFILL